MKTLLVLRHAKSSWSDSALDDHERPLNQRGRRDGPRIGKLVRELGLTPDVIISSDAVRARLTAEAVAEAAGLRRDIRFEAALYTASPADMLAVLRTVTKATAGTIMIVGHNPGLEELVAQLTGERPDLPTAALAQSPCQSIGGADVERSTRGRLLELWRPKKVRNRRVPVGCDHAAAHDPVYWLTFA